MAASQQPVQPKRIGHTRWVRLSHWIITVSFLTLAFTGVEILMVHPRLYWGEVGNDLTPALLELPISRNYRHGGWKDRRFPGSGFSGQRESYLRHFQQEWLGKESALSRSLVFVLPGAIYLLVGLSQSLRRNIVPRPAGSLPTRSGVKS
jgi:hypothetical protein